MSKNFQHKFRFQQAVRYNGKLAWIESSILNDKYHYQVRIDNQTDLYLVTEQELAPVDEGDVLLYER